MNKKGSHIDVILSFVIFISFVIFLYAIIQPSVSARDGKTAFLNQIGGQLIENMSGKNLSMIRVFLEPDAPQSCLSLSNFAATIGISTLNVSVRDIYGTDFPSYKSGGDLYIDMSANQNTEWLNVYYSLDFGIVGDNALGSCTSLDSTSPDSYTIKQIEQYQSYYIWENNTVELIGIYNMDYNGIKNWFNLTTGQNFGFDFTYQNGTMIGTNSNVPTYSNVYTQIFPIIYFSKNNLEAGNLIVTVW